MSRLHPVRLLVALLAVAVALVWALPSRSQAAPLTTSPAAAAAAAAYLSSQLVVDPASGGKAFVSAWTGTADPGMTASGVVALVSAGGHSADVAAMLTYLTSIARTYVDGSPSDTPGGASGRAANLAVAAAATGTPATDFGGVDLVAAMTSTAASGGQLTSFGTYADAMIVIGLKRTGSTLPADACTWLAAQQAADGSYGYSDWQTKAYVADVDSTAVVVQALGACGVTSYPAAGKARDWLVGQKAATGYWDTQYSPVNSTALAVSALGAVGVDSASAVAWLLSQQAGATPAGGLPGSKDAPTVSDVYATIQAMFAFTGTSLLSVGPNPIAVSMAPSTSASTSGSTSSSSSTSGSTSGSASAPATGSTSGSASGSSTSGSSKASSPGSTSGSASTSNSMSSSAPASATTTPATIGLSASTVVQGGSVTVVGRGFVSTVRGTVNSDPMDLGTAQPDATGAVTFTFSTAALSPGTHTVTLRSAEATLTSSVTVTAASAPLAATGAGVAPWLIGLVAGVLLAGVGLVVVGRRQRL